VASDEARAVIDEQSLATAYRRLLRDGEVQFDLPAFHRPEVPPWLQPLFDWLSHSGPVIKILFWAGLAIIVLLLLWSLYGWLAPVVRGWLGRPEPQALMQIWTPEAAPARALLAQADALAADGAFADAAHLLLLRSVEQLEARFPGRLRPSWTSRDIARVPMLPPAMAQAFGFIAGIVETGIFGQRPVSADDWSQCRSAYETAAFGTAA
jgi:hypothetical protein